MDRDPNKLTIEPVQSTSARNPLVSIIIVNYQGTAVTRECLLSLAGLAYSNHETILVDNGSCGSHRDEIEALFAEFPGVKAVKLPSNTGFAGGNDAGLKAANGEFVLLLNNDTVVNPGFIETLVQYLLDHPNVGIVQGKMLLPRFGGALDVCGSFATALGLPYHYGYHKPDGPKYQRSYPVFSGKGACLMFRREVIERAGGFLFDPDFFCYYEETDFCHRAWLAGLETHFVPSPPIQHFMGSTSDRMKQGFTLQHYLRNMAFSLWSHLEPLSLLRIMPPFLTLQAACVMLSVLLGRGWQCRAHWQALTTILTRFGKIRERRKLVARIRRQSDREIFAKVMRTPRLSYFIKTFTGNLASYVDEP